MTVTLLRHTAPENDLPRPPGLSQYGGTVENGVAMPGSVPTRADARVVRVIKCLRLLEHACYSAHDLAGRLRVSKRTVYRDLRLLEAAGVPLLKRTADDGYHVPAAAPG